MLSPYEAERAFEMEITRLHQYGGARSGSGTRARAERFSLREWLRARVGRRREEKTEAAAAKPQLVS